MVWVGAAAAIALLSVARAQDFNNIGKYESKGCWASIPSTFTQQGSSSSNSGLDCYTSCNDAGYSVIAVQGQNCYCGSVLPAGSADGSCGISCPGYPSEQCGGSSAYNIYVQKGVSVSTAGASSSAASTSTASSSTSSSTSDSSSTSTSSSSSSESSSSDSSSSATTTSSDSSSASSSNTPSVSTATVTASASRVSSTSSSSSSSTSADSSSSASASGTASKKSGISAGAIAGIVVGVVAGLIALALLLFFIWRRRQQEEFYSPNSSPHKFETSFNSGYNQDYPSLVDQRLNPELLNHRISIASLADARDYSRQILKVANPDEKP